MNIFYLDHDVYKCAEMHNNKHTVKMILEYAQLLSTAHRFLDGTLVIGVDRHLYVAIFLLVRGASPLTG